MKHRAIIVTLDKATLSWRSLESKRLAFEGVLNSMKNADFSLEIKHVNYTPEVVNGRITAKSFDSISHPLLKQGYDFVLVHMSRAQWLKFGIQPSLRGAAQNDTDEIAEGYFWADEITKRNGFNQFIETGLHEVSHLYCHGSKAVDETHTYHTANKTIVGLFLKYDMASYQRDRFLLKAKLSFLQGVLAKLKALQPSTLQHPVEDYRNAITQGYGAVNALYKLTGRHIGTDYATPIGTPVKAPWNGSVTTAGTGPATGNFCHFEYTFNGKKWEERWCHLKTVPEIGTYRRSDVVATTGNTGMSTGPHLHREKWANDVRVDLINKTNWSELTTDPETI